MRIRIIACFIAIEFLGFLVLKTVLQIISQNNFNKSDNDFGAFIYSYIIIVESVIAYSFTLFLLALAGFFISGRRKNTEYKSAFKMLGWVQFFILMLVIIYFFFLVKQAMHILIYPRYLFITKNNLPLGPCRIQVRFNGP